MSFNIQKSDSATGNFAKPLMLDGNRNDTVKNVEASANGKIVKQTLYINRKLFRRQTEVNPNDLLKNSSIIKDGRRPNYSFHLNPNKLKLRSDKTGSVATVNNLVGGNIYINKNFKMAEKEECGDSNIDKVSKHTKEIHINKEFLKNINNNTGDNSCYEFNKFLNSLNIASNQNCVELKDPDLIKQIGASISNDESTVKAYKTTSKCDIKKQESKNCLINPKMFNCSLSHVYGKLDSVKNDKSVLANLPIKSLKLFDKTKKDIEEIPCKISAAPSKSTKLQSDLKLVSHLLNKSNNIISPKKLENDLLPRINTFKSRNKIINMDQNKEKSSRAKGHKNSINKSLNIVNCGKRSSNRNMILENPILEDELNISRCLFDNKATGVSSSTNKNLLVKNGICESKINYGGRPLKCYKTRKLISPNKFKFVKVNQMSSNMISDVTVSNKINDGKQSSKIITANGKKLVRKSIDKLDEKIVPINKNITSSNFITLGSTKLVRKQINNKNTTSSKFITLGSTKLVRKQINKHENCFNKNDLIKTRISSPYKLTFLNRKIVRCPNLSLTPTIRSAQSVKSKYNLILNKNTNRIVSSYNMTSKMSKSSTLKATPNLHFPQMLKNKENLTCNLSARRLKSDLKAALKNQERKIMDIRRNLMNSQIRRTSRNMGGITCTTNKDKTSKIVSKDKLKLTNNIFKNKGDTFKVTSDGKSLSRINESFTNKKLGTSWRKMSFSSPRIDVAQSRANQAKQKSIALLTKKKKMINKPCYIFNRLGRCSAFERGLCNRLHDKKRVAICKKFLHGHCEDKNCLLSHDVGPSKMPTCRHFLAGMCFLDDCPYLHVKVNSSAPICIYFLEGYCPKADECKNRHEAICPEFEVKGSCAKGKSCPYPHPKYIQLKVQKQLNPVLDKNKSNLKKNADDEISKDKSTDDLKTYRYYTDKELETDDIKQNVSAKRTNDTRLDDSMAGCSNWLSKRPKLGVLPGFIPL